MSTVSTQQYFFDLFKKMSTGFFKQCASDGTCYGRVNPIRVGSQSSDDILQQDLSFYCPITHMNQLEQKDYNNCKVDEHNTMMADHLNLQYENYVYVCQSMHSRYNKKDDKYHCTRLVQKQESSVPFSVQPEVTVASSVQSNSLSDDEFANSVPERILKNAKQIQENSQQINLNTERLQTMQQLNKKTPLPRFGFARIE